MPAGMPALDATGFALGSAGKVLQKPVDSCCRRHGCRSGRAGCVVSVHCLRDEYPGDDEYGQYRRVNGEPVPAAVRARRRRLVCHAVPRNLLISRSVYGRQPHPRTASAGSTGSSLRRGDSAYATMVPCESKHYDHAADVIAGESAAPRESSCEQPVTTVPDATEVDVLLAVVTYNSQDVVVDLLKGLPDALGSCSWRLVVADNDSQDSTIERVREMQPEARIVQMGRNAGYAAGINAAVVAGGRARSVLVLNPDTRLDPGSIPIMLRRLQRPGVGIVVPRLLDSDRALVETLRREPNIRRALGDTILTARRAGRFPTWGELVTDRDCYVRETGADWAAGPAMLISRECLDACGGWGTSPSSSIQRRRSSAYEPATTGISSS